MRITIPISRPVLGKEELLAVRSVFASGILAQGPKVAEFEQAFAKFIGVKHAIATSSGTTALMAALVAHGIGPQDEVITTPFTFVATVNAILFTGAKPVFVDIGEDFNINAELIEQATTTKTRAILPVHLFGLPADMGTIMQIAKQYNLVVIEDACQAHGAAYRGQKVGSFGVGIFSFYPTKNMTTGEGGMVTTNDDEVAEKVRLFINHGMRQRYYHETLGYNFRMTEIAAAIGLEQLKKLPTFNSKRIENAMFFNEQLRPIKGLLTPIVYPDRVHVFHQYTVRVTPQFGMNRDQLIAYLAKKGIATGIYYPLPVYKQKHVQSLGLGVRCLMAERIAEEVVSIPVYPSLTMKQKEYIVKVLLDFCRSRGLLEI